MLRAEGLTKHYQSASLVNKVDLKVFSGLDLEVRSGELLAIVGESGAGKSSLLHLLAALDRPTKGEVWYGEQRLSSMSDRQAARFRNREIGYVWQFHYLLPEFSALENVALPLMARGVSRRQALVRAAHWLKEMGLADRVSHRSGELSGGEQQRVSLARALVVGPKLLLADEPTGDLDEKTAESIFSIIQQLRLSQAIAVVLVTHSMGFAKRCDRMVVLQKGQFGRVSP